MSLSNLRCIGLLFVFNLFFGTDGYYLQMQFDCIFSRKDLQDIKFAELFFFNKVEHVRYNSSLRKYTGYTEFGMKCTQILNSDPAKLAEEQVRMDSYCRRFVSLVYCNILEKTAEPYIKLRSLKPVSSKHPALLVCSVYNFYPKAIRVMWLRDGEEVTFDVTSTEELSNGDWYYQVHSHLEYTPKSGETISCNVEHASFPQPKVVDWDPSMPESERNKMTIGASGLVLGVSIAATGLTYYKKKSHEHVL
ncbi:H-2 class II histocompatibility antigen, E-S beta chain-like isoform X1 [Megalops cyprinoides]|uniref:H-2 class II histocompatibility antigen, E-S beta chain-like isoform X1 n=1 Tax=Megalops cyprinoides TaxID=118141 RepID=UPI0018651F02|nr:H-2 class II histocompatibility antigen, E-S beta chain-like isoform X1 [Megalops cyprinoides]